MKSVYLFERAGEDWGETSIVPISNTDNIFHRGCDNKDGRQRCKSEHCNAFRIECFAKRKNSMYVISKNRGK